MKKYLILGSLFTILTIATLRVSAANNGQGSGSSSNNNGNSNSQNKNQVQTQNQGGGSQLQVGTKEQEGLEADDTTTESSDGNGKGNGKKDKLSKTRSFVAQQIQKLLSVQTDKGGIGDQVKEWAKIQQQNHDKVQQHLSKIEGKTGLVRSLFGPDYKSLNALKAEMEQNRVRVQQLEQLKLKLINQSDITNVMEMITLLQQENTELGEKVLTEEQDGGLFGWLAKLLAK